jgi:hypothetical protein
MSDWRLEVPSGDSVVTTVYYVRRANLHVLKELHPPPVMSGRPRKGRESPGLIRQE